MPASCSLRLAKALRKNMWTSVCIYMGQNMSSKMIPGVTKLFLTKFLFQGLIFTTLTVCTYVYVWVQVPALLCIWVHVVDVFLHRIPIFNTLFLNDAYFNTVFPYWDYMLHI